MYNPKTENINETEIIGQLDILFCKFFTYGTDREKRKFFKLWRDSIGSTGSSTSEEWGEILFSIFRAYMA